MSKRIISALIVLTLLLPQMALAGTATIENTGENAYKSLRLIPEIYTQSEAHLADLRLEDDQGEMVPYFIYSGTDKVVGDQADYAMSLIDQYAKDEAYYFDYKVAQLPEGDVVANFLTVTTTDNFAKATQLWGSYDNQHWESVWAGTLFQVEGKSNLTIKFQTPQKFTHYRFELANNLEQINFTTVDLFYQPQVLGQDYFVESLSPSFRVEENGKTTSVIIQGLKNLKLDTLVLESDDRFKRVAKIPFVPQQKEIYNLSFGETVYQDCQFTFGGKTSLEEEFVLEIQNNDDRPIEIKGIMVTYYADEVVFKGDASQRFYLRFGDQGGTEKPIYDIASYKAQILQEPIDQLVIQGVAQAPIPQVPKALNGKAIFNGIILAVGILLSVLILKKMKRLG